MAISNAPRLFWPIFEAYPNMQLENTNDFKAALHHLGGPKTQWWADMKEFKLSENTIHELDIDTQKFLDKIGNRNLQFLRNKI